MADVVAENAIKGVWLYATFQLVKKILMTAGMRMTDGAYNATLSTVRILAGCSLLADLRVLTRMFRFA